MFLNIYTVIAIFALCQQVFCNPCNCGLGKGEDNCAAAGESDRASSNYPLVVRPQPLSKVDISVIPSHRPGGDLRNVVKVSGGRIVEIGGKIDPLRPIGDLCTCGKTIVTPANVPKPACAGCGGGVLDRHRFGPGGPHAPAGAPFGLRPGAPFDHNPGSPLRRPSGPHFESLRGHPFGSPGDHHSESFHRQHSKSSHLLHKSGPFGDGESARRYGEPHLVPFTFEGPGLRRNINGIRYGEDKDLHGLRLLSHRNNDVRRHGAPSEFRSWLSKGEGETSDSYYQIGGHGPETNRPLAAHSDRSTKIGDVVIDYPICGPPMIQAQRARPINSNVPADVISRALVHKQLQQKQIKVEHLQFGTATRPREEITVISTKKPQFDEASYYKRNGQILEMGNLDRKVEEVEEVEDDEEEDEQEQDSEPISIRPISYQAIGFVPTKDARPKFITPVSAPRAVEPIPSCGVDPPPHCPNGFKGGEMIITNNAGCQED